MTTHSTARSPFLGFFSISNSNLKYFNVQSPIFYSHPFSLYHAMLLRTPSASFT